MNASSPGASATPARRRSRCSTRAGDPAETLSRDLRSVLHDQAARRGQRPRSVGLLRDRGRARGTAARGEPRRRRRALRRRAARRGADLSVRPRVRRRLTARVRARPAARVRRRGRAGAGRSRPSSRERLRQRQRRYARPPFWTRMTSSCSASGRRRSPRARPARGRQRRPRCATGAEPTVTWVGHATFLVQLDGVNILTDPHWSERASPLSFAGPAADAARAALRGPAAHPRRPDLARSLRPPGRRDGEAPGRDASAALPRAARAQGVVRGPRDHRRRGARLVGRPHGVRAHVHVRAGPALLGPHALGQPSPLERLGRRRRATAPLLRRRHRLLRAGFKEIGARLGPFDLAAIPIGAYAGRHHEGEPYVARGSAAGLRRRARPAVRPIHWGTFDLAEEPLDEPPGAPAAEARRSSSDPDRVWILRHGETRRW